ncbi:lipopolysaccharide biosynthesis protein [Fulvivirga ulvae]|nr:lipopolysaccharide biosynthesis protein [Fulvivirga ulvae]
MSGTLLRQGSGFIISIFLARLLEPSEFGLVGMAMVFISISQVFIDVGFASALIQNKENTRLTYSSVFYLNLSVGLFLTVLFYFLAPFVGSFYNNTEITGLLKWLSLIFIFNSLNQVQAAILKRELNFKLLTVRGVISNLVGGVLGVVFAFQGFGVYALVIQQLSTSFLGTILLWSASGWKPDFSFSLKELKKLTGFSAFMFFDRFASMIFQKLDILFIGKVFSPATLGFYSRAESLNSQVTTYTSKSLMSVFFPVLSGLQDDLDKFNKVYFKVVSFICFLSFLISGLLFILAEPIIIGLFGENWAFSIVLFQILVFKSFNPPLNSMMLNALLSRGKSKENFKIGIVRKIIRALPIVIGLLYGLIPFVWAVTGLSYILTVYNSYFIQRYLGISMIYHLRKIFEGIIPFIIFVLLAYYLGNTLLIKIILSIVYIIFYLFYSSLIRMEGLVLAREEFSNILKKIL